MKEEISMLSVCNHQMKMSLSGNDRGQRHKNIHPHHEKHIAPLTGRVPTGSHYPTQHQLIFQIKMAEIVF